MVEVTESCPDRLRRAWISPELRRRENLTTLTQASLLFYAVSPQCFDPSHNPVPCGP